MLTGSTKQCHFAPGCATLI